MSTMTYLMRLKPEEKTLFQTAARRKGVSVAEFLREAGRAAARSLGAEPASLALSRAGFTLPEQPGKTEREKIRSAITARHVSR